MTLEGIISRIAGALSPLEIAVIVIGFIIVSVIVARDVGAPVSLGGLLVSVLILVFGAVLLIAGLVLIALVFGTL